MNNIKICLKINKCKLCEKEYTHLQELQKHIGRAHKNEITKEEYLSQYDKAKLNSILNLIASRWDFEGLNPPYIESLEKYFSVGVMKRQPKRKVDEVQSKIESEKEIERPMPIKPSDIKSMLRALLIFLFCPFFLLNLLLVF